MHVMIIVPTISGTMITSFLSSLSSDKNEKLILQPIIDKSGNFHSQQDLRHKTHQVLNVPHECKESLLLGRIFACQLSFHSISYNRSQHYMHKLHTGNFLRTRLCIYLQERMTARKNLAPSSSPA